MNDLIINIKIKPKSNIDICLSLNCDSYYSYVNYNVIINRTK